MIAQIILNNNSHAADRLFDYRVGADMSDEISVGRRVRVPFGRTNKLSEGYVYALKDESEYASLKELSGFVDGYVYFDEKKAELADFMRHRYFCSYISAIKCFIPTGIGTKFTRYFSLADKSDEELQKFCAHSVTADKIVNCLKAYGEMSEENIKDEVGKKNVTSVLNKLLDLKLVNLATRESRAVKDSIKTFVELIIDRDEAYSVIDSISSRAKARARALEVIADNRMIELSELLLCASCQKSAVDALVNAGYAAYNEVVCNDDALIEIDPSKKEKKILTSQQQNAVDTISPAIESKKKSVFLIHGVTGSGKTEVYLNLIEKTISMGRNAIFLVPEISLTPQMISFFYSRFGDKVAVLHSKLTPKQRYNEWMKIKNGEVSIAVGARSAVFAPFSDIGLIIIDEEHETTYKSEMSPRYDAVEIARFIIRQNDAVLVLASATPSVDSYFKAKSGAFSLVKMPTRVNNAPLPEVKICDMRLEMENGNMSIFSKELQNALEDNLKKGEQSILFLNRRGFSGFVSCRKCGYVMKCPNCNVSLTYHKSNGKMVCHYCDYKTSVAKSCPSCDSKHIKFFGIGTEKIVDEVNKLFPKANVIRMDADTTGGRMSHETILNTFAQGKADILVGTQMITKGLDFENVTLVGIVAADMSLCVDDYRAGERTFDLITQVAGRAGRAQKKGYAIIQTYNPEDEIIICSSMQDYKSFYKDEIETRMFLGYPPFSEFINFVFSSKSQKSALEKANSFYNELIPRLKETAFSGMVFKPCEAPLFRVNNKYRYHFLIKTPYKRDIYNIIRDVYDSHMGGKTPVTISIDVNPNSMH